MGRYQKMPARRSRGGSWRRFVACLHTARSLCGRQDVRPAGCGEGRGEREGREGRGSGTEWKVYIYERYIYIYIYMYVCAHI